MAELNDLEDELAMLKEQREEFDDEVAKEMFDLGISSLETRIRELKDEELAEEEVKEAERAYYSPIGQMIRAVLWEIGYDYATTEDYPRMVEVAADSLARDKMVLTRADN